jgi:hypothetical protein
LGRYLFADEVLGGGSFKRVKVGEEPHELLGFLGRVFLEINR